MPTNLLAGDSVEIAFSHQILEFFRQLHIEWVTHAVDKVQMTSR